MADRKVTDPPVADSQKPQSPPPDGFQRKNRLVASISLTYLSLTILNLIIFWVAIGSNQISLISQNALLSTQTVSYEILRRLQTLTDSAQNKDWLNDMLSDKNERAAALMLERLRADRQEKSLLVNDFQIATSDNRIVYEYPPRGGKPRTLERDSFQKVLRSLQLLELKGQLFYGVPDLSNYTVEIYIPMTNSGSRDLVFKSRIPMASIQKELRALIILALLMIGTMLVVQVIFGLILFRRLVSPIVRLADGAHSVATGDYSVSIDAGRRNDEVGFLVHTFNKMAESLKEKTTRLQSTITQLDQRNEEMQNELMIAQNIQQGVMPQKNLSGRFTSSVYFSPLETVSGDYYDFFTLPDGSTGILITDASGHGVPAALITIMAKVYFSEAAAKNLGTAKTLAEVNKQVRQVIVTSHFLTAFYIIIHPDLSAEYACASHQLSYILRKKEGKIETLDVDGFFIGMDIDSGIEYATKKTKFHPGDKLILYTDGITEGTNAQHEQYGATRFTNQIRAAAELAPEDMIASIIADYHNFTGNAPRTDDCTLMVIEVTDKGGKAAARSASKSGEGKSPRPSRKAAATKRK